MSYALSASSSWADTCPIPPTNVSPSVKSKVSFDPKSGQYTYEYTVSNAVNAVLPIDLFAILSPQSPLELRSPDHWEGHFIALPDLDTNIVWGTSALDPNDTRADDRTYNGPPLKLFYTVKPGKSLSGFSFKSSSPPGPVKFFAEGESEAPTTTPTAYDDEPEPNCPGFNEGPRFKTMLGGVTEGPIPPGTIPISIRLLKETGEWRSHEYNPDKDTGKLSVLVLPSKDFDPSTLTVPSVKLGYGEAPVISSKPLPGFKDRDDAWGDWEKSSKRILPDRAKEDEKERSRKKALLLTFDLKTVGIRCDLDKALFLVGKTSDGKDVVGSVPITTKDCKPWSGKKPLPKRKARPRH